MLNSISNYSANYATSYEFNQKMTSQPAVRNPQLLMDTYQRNDGSTATRFDKVGAVQDASADADTSAEKPDETKFRELLHQFVGQTLFGQMLKSMRATQEKNPYFHGGRAEEIFQSQLDMQLTDEMTKASSKTLSEPMYKLMTAKSANV
ncbi:hypothetical protein FACS1894170_07290 [Planctomycetales bacterium]|nr:hypothetical protein FACS1894170_07290 [Planctomycetales bacterium]